jgi:hypothetical protein
VSDAETYDTPWREVTSGNAKSLRARRRLPDDDRADREHADLVLLLVVVLELHDTVDERVDGIVGAHADITAGMPLRTTLARDDVAGGHELTAVLLDAAKLRIRIAPVA